MSGTLPIVLAVVPLLSNIKLAVPTLFVLFICPVLTLFVGLESDILLSEEFVNDPIVAVPGTYKGLNAPSIWVLFM